MLNWDLLGFGHRRMVVNGYSPLLIEPMEVLTQSLISENMLLISLSQMEIGLNTIAVDM